MDIVTKTEENKRRRELHIVKEYLKFRNFTDLDVDPLPTSDVKIPDFWVPKLGWLIEIKCPQDEIYETESNYEDRLASELKKEIDKTIKEHFPTKFFQIDIAYDYDPNNNHLQAIKKESVVVKIINAIKERKDFIILPPIRCRKFLTSYGLKGTIAETKQKSIIEVLLISLHHVNKENCLDKIIIKSISKANAQLSNIPSEIKGRVTRRILLFGKCYYNVFADEILSQKFSTPNIDEICVFGEDSFDFERVVLR